MKNCYFHRMTGLGMTLVMPCTFLACTTSNAFAQERLSADDAPGVIYQYPLPSAQAVSPTTGIGIRVASTIDEQSLGGPFTAIGSRSGAHVLHAHLTRKRNMAIFQSATPFLEDEEVSVDLGIRLLDETPVQEHFTFHTAVRPATIHSAPIHVSTKDALSALDFSNFASDSLMLTVTVDRGATPGTLYYANVGWQQLPTGSFLATLDEHGNVLKEKNLNRSSAMGFTRQPNGMLTYFDNATTQYYALDTNWNLVDSFSIVHDYHPDGHEFIMFPDSSYAIIGATQDARDMRQYITGGNIDANVTGGLIQLFDKDKNIIFEWRGIDHMNITDAVHVSLTSPFIDFQHMNALTFEHPNASTIDSAGDIIFSSRHLSEITCIDQDGHFVWRFGGAHNQFQLLGDSIWFSWQHDIRMLPNGHLTMFDNGNFDSLPSAPGQFIHNSRALEYELDTSAKTARLVWQFSHTPETYSDAMGSVQRLLNGNTLIGWGDDTIAYTEIDPHGLTLYEAQAQPGNFSYRVWKDTPQLSAAAVADGPAVSAPELHIVLSRAGRATASYALADGGEVSLALFDELGREVQTLARPRYMDAGPHTFEFTLDRLPSAVYYCRLLTSHGNSVAALNTFH